MQGQGELHKVYATFDVSRNVDERMTTFAVKATTERMEGIEIYVKGTDDIKFHVVEVSPAETEDRLQRWPTPKSTSDNRLKWWHFTVTHEGSGPVTLIFRKQGVPFMRRVLYPSGFEVTKVYY